MKELQNSTHYLEIEKEELEDTIDETRDSLKEKEKFQIIRKAVREEKIGK